MYMYFFPTSSEEHLTTSLFLAHQGMLTNIRTRLLGVSNVLAGLSFVSDLIIEYFLSCACCKKKSSLLTAHLGAFRNQVHCFTIDIVSCSHNSLPSSHPYRRSSTLSGWRRVGWPPRGRRWPTVRTSLRWPPSGPSCPCNTRPRPRSSTPTRSTYSRPTLCPRASSRN